MTDQLGVALTNQDILLLVLVLAWIWTWKGIALWKAARLSHKWWFIAFVVINLYTFGILEIFYIFVIASRYKVESTEVDENQPAKSAKTDQ